MAGNLKSVSRDFLHGHCHHRAAVGAPAPAPHTHIHIAPNRHHMHGVHALVSLHGPIAGNPHTLWRPRRKRDKQGAN